MMDTTVRRVPINMGLDLRGGTHLALEVDQSEGPVADPGDAIKRAEIKVRSRLDELYGHEALVQLAGPSRLIVEIPGEKDPGRAKRDEAAIGQAEGWRALLFEARRRVREQDPTAVAAYVRSILPEAIEPLTKAVGGVEVDADEVVVRFHPPDTLVPKPVNGRIVECLLY